MVDFDLTVEGTRLLALLYEVYRARRGEGVSRAQAAFFGTSGDIQAKYLPSMTPADVAALCFELRRKGRISGSPADEMLVHIRLQNIENGR